MCKKNKPLVHLHCHTYHSILDGSGSIDDYIKKAKEYGHPAIAITDHGTVSGTFEHYQKCKAAGIKPIIGMEAYLNDKMGQFSSKQDEGKDNHQVLLVKNKDGFVNLNRLVYRSMTEGFYYRPRITTDWLLENKNGLIATSSCLASKLSHLLLSSKENAAEDYFRLFLREFGEDFYAEIQLNEAKSKEGVEIQKLYNNFIIKMAQKYGVPTILTGDVHYASKEDNKLQDTLIAINQQSKLGSSFALQTRSLYYSNGNDFHDFNKKFGFNYDEKFIDECLENTIDVADKCNFEFEIGVEKYPVYEPTEDVASYFKTNNNVEIIKKLAHAKLLQKLKKYQEIGMYDVTEEFVKKYQDRLNYEISVIESKKMIDYFLVNWEIIRDYRSRGFEVGPARGSAAGSLLSWCLDITKIDPVRFDLYFERFLNPERNSPPDIDVDYMTNTDDVVDEFLYKKYGKERVLPVATFSTFNEKGCLKDVVRAHRGQEATGFDSDVFQVTKEMPNFDKVEYDLKWWFQNWPKDEKCSDTTRRFLTDPNNSEILQQTLKLQGQIRGVGQHAAGVVITPSSCWEYIPTNIISKNKKVVTAFQEADKSGKDLSELGILKLDRLKLETINIIMDSIELIKKNHNIDIKNELDFIDINNKELYEELRIGMNHGIFQFESPGMNALIRGIQIENFNELVAANALYRPGPMGIGAHEEYIKNKFDKSNIKYIHQSVEPILKETNGVMIYQEQLMFIADKIGNTGLGAGDSLRRYMDKASKIIGKEAAGEELSDKEKNDKNYQGFKKYWDKFLDGAEKNGYKKVEVDALKGWIIKYLGYSFNKSHSLSYSYLALQTLYLKRYYPLEFYCSLLNHPKSSGDKDEQNKWLTSAIYSAISKGIKILPPSLKSGKLWSITGKDEISMGLSSIDGFGDAAYDELIEIAKKKGKPIYEFTKEEFFSQNFSKFNKSAFESCLKAGVFDSFSKSRNYLEALKEGKKASKTKHSEKQLSMWDLSSFETMPNVDESLYEETSEVVKKIEFIQVCNIDLDEVLFVSEIKKSVESKHGYMENILNYSNPGLYYFVIKEVKVNQTKKGGIYLRLKIGDGLSSEYINMFDPMASKYANFFNRNGVYIANFTKNDKGFINFHSKSQIKEA